MDYFDKFIRRMNLPGTTNLWAFGYPERIRYKREHEYRRDLCQTSLRFESEESQKNGRVPLEETRPFLRNCVAKGRYRLRGPDITVSNLASNSSEGSYCVRRPYT
ncbi:hypothetical protein SCOR_22045 [Sulfidibacter corallicola]